MTPAEAKIRNDALEEAAELAQTYFVGIFTGWTSDSMISLDYAEDAANECGPICAEAIRSLKVSI